MILDESFSVGTIGRTGRGLTELYNVPATSVDMIVGSLANAFCSAGGFCAGSSVVTEHQRINGTSFVFSAAMPPLLAVSSSEGIHILTDSPSIMTTLQENVRAIRSVLDKVDCITIPSHPASPIIHIYVKPLPTSTLVPPPADAPKPSGSGKSNPASVVPYNPVAFKNDEEERLLQQVVEDCLAQGVMITRAKRLQGQELVQPRPSIRVSVTAGLTKKDCERAAGVIKASLIKVLGRRK